MTNSLEIIHFLSFHECWSAHGSGYAAVRFLVDFCFSRSVELHEKVIGTFNCYSGSLAWTARPLIR
ncbi:hypothetical protein EPG66_12125 [Pantoea pleuroti]|nr:hypothetical protein [Pantoea pleuroti]